VANLPLSSQADSLDSLTVTREQFRLQQSDLLEFLAQALGNVSGDYNTQPVSPTGVVLQGTPTLAAGAEPTAVDDSLRLACTRWVRRNAISAGAVAPLNPVRGQAWADTGSDPPAIKVWDDTPGPGSWVTLGLVPDATTTTKGLVQLADAAAITNRTAGRVVDAAQLSAAGRVLNVTHYTDGGAYGTSTTYILANQLYFNYTPKSANSKLILHATFQAGIARIDDLYTTGFFSLSEGLAAIGTSLELTSQGGAHGSKVESAGALSCSLTNTSTNNRQFGILHRTNYVSAPVRTANIQCTIIEVAN